MVQYPSAPHGRLASKQGGTAAARMRGSKTKGRKLFFFEKKNQKTFDRGRACWAAPRTQSRKSFLVLFFKKELLSFTMRAPAGTALAAS
jgi:hypothetical protein